MENERAKQVMENFLREVRDLGPEITGMCGIDSPNWESSLSQVYGIENSDGVNEILANFLDALCIQYGWGAVELLEFVQQAIYKVAEAMQFRTPIQDLPPS